MKKKRIGFAFIIIIFSISVFGIGLYIHDLCTINKICFYEYDFKDFNTLDKVFENFGFRHRAVFSEEREKYILSENCSIFYCESQIYSPYENKENIRFSFPSGKIRKYLEKKLSKYYTDYFDQKDFPGLLLPLKNVSCYKYLDRNFYIGENNHGSYLYIESDNKSPLTEYVN